MYSVPLRFIEDTINLLDRREGTKPYKPLCHLRSRWEIVANRKIDAHFTHLLEIRLWNDEDSRTTRFAVTKDEGRQQLYWDEVYSTRARVTRVEFIEFNYDYEYEEFEELNPENLKRLRSILARNIYPTGVNLHYPADFNEELVAQLVTSLTRINYFQCDYVSAGLVRTTLEHALSRGPVASFFRRGWFEITQETLRLVDQLVSSPHIRVLELQVASSSPISADTCMEMIFDRLEKSRFVRRVEFYGPLERSEALLKRAEQMGFWFQYVPEMEGSYPGFIRVHCSIDDDHVCLTDS